MFCLGLSEWMLIHDRSLITGLPLDSEELEENWTAAQVLTCSLTHPKKE